MKTARKPSAPLANGNATSLSDKKDIVQYCADLQVAVESVEKSSPSSPELLEKLSALILKLGDIQLGSKQPWNKVFALVSNDCVDLC